MRAKAVLTEVKKVAMQENESNKLYFHHKYVPTVEEEREKYFSDLNKSVQAWASTAKNNWYNIIKEKNEIPDMGKEFANHNRKNNDQKMNITAFGGFLEKCYKIIQ